jgi:tetratricopeptide repeat protein
MTKLSEKSKHQLLFIIVATVAIVTRAVLFAFWIDSPFRYYSTVGGLDMKTLLDMGTLFYHGQNTFALYNLLIAGTMLCNNAVISVTAIIVIQQLMGIATSLLTAWICLKLTGRKVMAFTAGIISALYAPALIYEAVTLRESLFVFTAMLSLATLIKLHQKRFSPAWLFLTGVILTLPLTVRLSALLWLGVAIATVQYLMFNKLRKQNNNVKLSINKTFKPMAILLSGVLLIVTLVAALNFKQSGAVTPISRQYLEYILTMGRQVNPQTVNIHVSGNSASTTEIVTAKNETTGGIAYMINCLNKFGKLFYQYEVPNNINYYFMREQLFPCGVLPGPGMVIPLAVAGIILLVLRKRFLRKETILLLYILAFAIPITLFLPLGRYRLILYPVFSILMLYPLQLILCYLSKLKKMDAKRTEGGDGEAKMTEGRDGEAARLGSGKTGNGRMGEKDQTSNENNAKNIIKTWIGLKICGIILLVGTVYVVTIPENTKLRASDFNTHGKAFQQQEGDTVNTENCFAAAYQLNPTSPAVAINYTDILLKHGKTKQALQTISPAWKSHPKNAGVALFASSALLCNGMPKQAEFVLLQAGEPAATSGQRLYYYNLAESYRLQNKHKQAKKAYAKFKILSTKEL